VVENRVYDTTLHDRMGTTLSVACILIVSEKRVPLVREKILPSVLDAGFDEVCWVGDGEPGEGYRFLPVPPLTRTTNDALVKRDVGTVATTSDWLLYLCDDHAFRGAWGEDFSDADVIVPQRYCTVNGQRIPLNMGFDTNDPNFPYLGGHAGFFRRSLIQARPWTSMPHDRLWDLHASRIQMQMGARFAQSQSLVVEDLEPEARPWL